jgi:hypothetical protein
VRVCWREFEMTGWRVEKRTDEGVFQRDYDLIRDATAGALRAGKLLVPSCMTITSMSGHSVEPASTLTRSYCGSIEVEPAKTAASWSLGVKGPRQTSSLGSPVVARNGVCMIRKRRIRTMICVCCVFWWLFQITVLTEKQRLVLLYASYDC